MLPFGMPATPHPARSTSNPSLATHSHFSALYLCAEAQLRAGKALLWVQQPAHQPADAALIPHAAPLSGIVSPGHALWTADPQAGGGMRCGVCLTRREPQQLPQISMPSYLWRHSVPTKLIEMKFSQAGKIWVSFVPGVCLGGWRPPAGIK